jgi:hypothetical protein
MKKRTGIFGYFSSYSQTGLKSINEQAVFAGDATVL